MNQTLNLARKWRSKHFDEIVGQELSVRLLKNSLYKGQLFPVYLFSGQRGCGKTTTARVFAAAINCFSLENFQKNPQNTILPCLNCESCKSMISGNHPDFIEIDAASNTGVDNVRQIIDAASLLPVIAKKKIYLIDEAHMLSKAAFNALLKILEEPPTSVIFMLATTEIHKIIDTVKSRCFQLFFPAIEKNQLVEHLVAICTKEEIPFEHEGLKLIAQESEGSLRDGINLMERIRLAYPVVNKKAILEILGYIDDTRLIELFGIILKSDIQEVLNFINAISLSNFTPITVWKKFVEIIRIAIWLKYSAITNQFPEDILEHIKNVPVQKLVAMLEIAYEYEPLLIKTSAAYEMLEMMLIKMSLSPSFEQIKDISTIKTTEKIAESQKKTSEPTTVVKSTESRPETINGPWALVNQEIEKLKDPLVGSIFKQGKLIKTDLENLKIYVEFPQELKFFDELLTNTKNVWKPIIEKVFGQKYELDAQYIIAANNESLIAKPVQVNQPQVTSENIVEITIKPINKLDFQDKEKWKITNTLLEVFPGTVSQVENN